MSRGRTPVVLLDAIESLAVQLVHALSLAGGYRLTALCLHDNALRHSWHCRVVRCPAWRWDAGPEQLAALLPAPGAILLPVSAEAVAWTVRHRDALAADWRLPLLPQAGALATVRDKAALSEFAVAHGVPVPRSARPAADGGLADPPPLPVLLKPRQGSAGAGIERIDDAAALRARLAAAAGAADAYQVQSRIEGEDVSCGLLCDAGRVLAAVAYVGLAREGAFGPIRSMRIVDDPAALAVAARTVAALRWSGLANVDLRRAADGRVYLLEINPRPWGNLRGALLAGLNFADLWCRSAVGALLPQPPLTRGTYVATVDALALWRERLRPGAAPTPLPAWRETGLRFVCRDPWLHLRAFLHHRGGGGWRALWRHLAGHPAPPLAAPAPRHAATSLQGDPVDRAGVLR